MHVYKFGGTSVGTPENAKKILKILTAKDVRNDIFVCSALSGVTNRLISLCDQVTKKKKSTETLAELKKEHLDYLVELNLTPSVAIEQIFTELSSNVETLRKDVKNLATRALIISTGERLSANIFYAFFTNHFKLISLIDSASLIKTNDNYFNAKVDFKSSNQLIKAAIEADPNSLKIIPGFIASNNQNKITLLGRGGSDYTAAIFAGAIEAKTLEIWTDVSGIYTADPRIVSDAFPVNEISYAETMELAHFGAKVIYTPAIQPAAIKNIPILIKNTFAPKEAGTLVIKYSKEKSKKSKIIAGLSARTNVSLILIEGAGLIENTGTAARVFKSLGDRDINILLISQASSEYSISLGINDFDTEKALEVLNQEFENELNNSRIKPLTTKTDLSIVSVVGENMRQKTDSAGRMFRILGKHSINVNAIAQGASEINISAVVETKQKDKCLNVLHQEFFFPDRKEINVFILGIGLIGSKLLAQIKNYQLQLRKENCGIQVLGIANTTRCLFSKAGLNLSGLDPAELKNGDKFNLKDLIQKLKDTQLPNLVVVDCTASVEVASTYLNCLENDISVVTPNKKAQSANNQYFQSILQESKKRNVDFLFETSVGASLPIIRTLRDLLNSGDEIIAIEGVFSGTLSYLFNHFSSKTAFSELVKEAKLAGLTEPDPRSDLDGSDVARKILILARLVGANLELDEVEVQSLVPEACCETKTIEDFFKELKNHDTDFKERVTLAENLNSKLCYISEYRDGKAKVGLKTISQDHPFYNLPAGDNIISFTTRRYNERPLVIQGAGAGDSVTAAGILADLIQLANLH